MKKILYILSVLVLVISSCKKDDAVYMDSLEKAPFVYFKSAPPAVVGVDNISDLVYSGTLDASGPVASYELQIYASLSGVETDTFTVSTFTSFPANFSLNAQQIADNLEVTIADLSFGDSFGFVGIITSEDGTVYYSSSPELEETVVDGEVTERVYHPNGKVHEEVPDLSNGYKSGFDFNFIIGCPQNSFDAASMAGTYAWTVDPWETWVVDGIFEVVAGPGENQLTCIDVFDHAVPGDASATYDMIIDVDPVTGVATVSQQNTWHPATWGLADWGQGYHEGTGQIFGCANIIMLDLKIFDEAGHSWGVNPYMAVKQ